MRNVYREHTAAKYGNGALNLVLQGELRVHGRRASTCEQVR